MSNVFIKHYHSPLGWVEIKGTEEYITSVMVYDEVKGEDSKYIPEVLMQCQRELEQYFAGTLQKFKVPLQPKGTDFQKQVWHELMNIPYGETRTYGAIANTISNDPNQSRAVGTANGQNPIWIILPCHRVIGANGKLTGYAGGIWRKEWLLQHEGKTSGKRLDLFS